MFLKTSIFFLLLCITSFQASPSRNIDENGLLEQILKKAKEIYDKLIQTVKGIVTGALNKLKDLSEKLTKLAEDAIAAAKKQIDTIVNKAKEIINKIIESAGGSQNIGECMKYVDKLEALPAQLVASETACVTTEMDAGMKIIVNAVDTINKMYDTVAKFPSRLQECLKEPITAVKCILDVVSDMVHIQSEIPLEIQKEIQAAVDFINGIDERIQDCAIGVVANGKTEAMKIINDMKECVANIIPSE